MARKFAQIQVAIWSDDDFKSMPAREQHMYFVLLSQARMNLCGVLDFLPNRLAICVDEWTPSDVTDLVKALEERRYVVVDRESHELVVRSFIRNDGLLAKPNMAKAMASDFAEVMSDSLRSTIELELRRAFREDPNLTGWNAIREVNPVLHANVTKGTA